MPEYTYGRGTHEQFDAYVEFIDLVFGFNKENGFPTFLPKLYRPELDPAYNSFNVMDGDKFVAAVGSFPLAMSVAGMELKGTGIGNVAVHPDHRSEGHMKKLMEMSIDDMVARGMDYSSLGGQRQRYNYFSFDSCGPLYRYRIGPNNLRHFFPVGSAWKLTMQEVTAADGEILDAIAALSDSQAFHPIRNRAELYPILCSWDARPYAFFENGKFAGYCVLNKEKDFVSEIVTADTANLIEMVRCLAAENTVRLNIPAFRPDYCHVLEPYIENVDINSGEMFSVFCFRRVVQAFLTLKAGYANLADGKLPVLVHGRGGDEQLAICVQNNQVTVTETDEAPMLELTHLDAMRLFFAPVCSIRESAPAVAGSWFPVPLCQYSADAV